jgi:hypothetical protein
LIIYISVDFERKGWDYEDEPSPLLPPPTSFQHTNQHQRESENESQRLTWEKQAMDQIKAGAIFFFF